MDLSRAVETLVFPNRRVDSVDYSPDGSFIVYSSVAPGTTEEDLFYSQPNGQNDQNLTSTQSFRERKPRIDPFARTAVYEGIDDSGVSRIYLFAQTALTSGPAPGRSRGVQPDFDSSEDIGGVAMGFGGCRINGLAVSGRSHARKSLDT